jgi:hypothetical protein
MNIHLKSLDGPVRIPPLCWVSYEVMITGYSLYNCAHTNRIIYILASALSKHGHLATYRNALII